MNAFRWPHKNILFFSRSEWVLERLCLDTFLQHSLRLTVDRNDVLLCIILSATLPSSPPSFPLILDVVVMTVVRGLRCLKGRQLLPILSITECQALTILEWNESREVQPPTSFQTNVYVNVCAYSTVCTLACLCLCLLRVCPSLAFWYILLSVTERQVEWRPTLLALCLTCEIQHPLRWCDTSLSQWVPAWV